MKFASKIIAFLASIGGSMLLSAEAISQGPRKIAAGSVILWVGDDGNVYSSGDAEPHRGDNSEVKRTHFEKIEGLSDIVSVDIAVESAVALASDGHVWRVAPVVAKYDGLSDIKAVALGHGHLVALHNDGRVFTVAIRSNANQEGAMGTGDFKTTDANFGVVEIKGINDAVAVEANESATYVLRADGSVWGVGSRLVLGNQYSVMQVHGQDAEALCQPTLAPIKGLSKIVAVSAGKGYAIALDQNGDVWAWGNIGEDILGVEEESPERTIESFAPMKIAGLKNIVTISAGYDFILATNRSGEVLGVGGNYHKTLLTGDDEPVLGQARRLPGFEEHGKTQQVFAGHYNGFALMQSGKYVGWGANVSTIGGFHPTADPTIATPVEMDPNLRPDPPSDTIRDGGVKMTIFLRLNSYFFSKETVTLAIDGEVVTTLTVDQANDDVEASIEVAKGFHSYRVSGEATTNEGERHKIDFSSVLMVSPHTISEQFESLSEEHGPVEAFRRIQAKIEAFDETMKSPALNLESSGPLTADQVSQLETNLGIALPDSYKEALQKIGPFRIGSADNPLPYVGLFLPKLERNVDQFAKQAEALAGKTEGIANPKWAETVGFFEQLKVELAGAKEEGLRKSWHRNLILASYDELLCMLVRQEHFDDTQPAPILWSYFFEEGEDENEEPIGYFLWNEMPSNGEQTLELLKSGCSDAICEGYQRLGLAPNISPKTGERVYSILETKLEYAPKAGEVLKYQLRSDGW